MTPKHHYGQYELQRGPLFVAQELPAPFGELVMFATSCNLSKLAGALFTRVRGPRRLPTLIFVEWDASRLAGRTRPLQIGRRGPQWEGEGGGKSIIPRLVTPQGAGGSFNGGPSHRRWHAAPHPRPDVRSSVARCPAGRSSGTRAAPWRRRFLPRKQRRVIRIESSLLVGSCVALRALWNGCAPTVWGR